jgi:hypothetical protein
VKLEKETKARNNSRRAVVNLTDRAMDLDEDIDRLEPVVEKNNESSVCDESKTDSDKEVPLGDFDMEESDNKEEELDWMDFIGMVLG